MSKKLPLYILLVFLIVVNGFFLYNYLGAGPNNNTKEPMRPKMFLTKELGFNPAQKARFDVLDKKHHKRMQNISSEIRVLKDDMFNGFSDASFDESKIIALTKLIGEKEAAKDLEVFRYFSKIKEICTAEQQETFNNILKDALRRGDRAQGPPERRPGERREDGPNGHRPPPPMDGEGMEQMPPPSQ
ncbi:Spy/CpxP family protein refolding chaperone [Algibacter sp. AS12]|uniref:Spy/CpxP family protein refolding chaperone n=1 Tax=Algibacter sp. AS12 TaxID=3135773 RepID=UPI00398B9134